MGIDAIQADLKRTNAMLNKLISIVEHPSEREDELNRMVHDMGGRSKVLGDDELMTTVAAAAAQTREKQDGGAKATATDGAKIAETEDAVLSATERHDLRLPLEAILQQNAAIYTEKLDAQVARITEKLDKLQSSSEMILKTLAGGSWERISHPDIRQIWKDNDWRASVEARFFVLAIHDYYDDYFRGGHQPASKADPISTESRSARFSQTTEADSWCLKYLCVKYTSSLMEVFDVDGSGFVRVAEVNDFCASIPEGLNLLQWLAYWAHGMLIHRR